MGFFSNLFKKKTPEPAAPAAPVKAAGPQIIASPMTGTVMALTDMPEPVFSTEALGKGCAIEPSVPEVVAPFDGKIEQVADTKHAVGITSNGGVEVLIHVGIDTVELNGEGFAPQVKVGDIVKKGDLLLKFDPAAIAAKGKPVTTAVIVTNTDDYGTVELIAPVGEIVKGADAVKVE